MLTIKASQNLLCLQGKKLLLILRLSWILGYPALQAAQPTGGHISQEETSVSSIWGNQIDPTLSQVAMPFSNPTNTNNLPLTPLAPWNFTPTYTIGHHTPLLYNFSVNTPNIAPCSPFINNPFERPPYHFPDGATSASGYFPEENQLLFSTPNSSTPLLPANHPDLPPQVTVPEEQQATMSHFHLPKNKSKTCPYCGKKCKQHSHLESHIRTHTKEKPYQCTYCSKRFAQKNNLTRHIRIHTKEKPFKCSYCSKKFAVKNNLTTHLRTHTKEKPFTCTYCQKSFTQKHSLTTHIRTHTREKPFLCIYCSKRFAHKHNLTTHLRTHTKEKPFACAYCSKTFAQQSTLTTHIRTHTKEKPFTCAYCGKSFTQQPSLKNHIKSQHST